MANIEELLGGMATGDKKEYTPEEIKEMADEYKSLKESSTNKEKEDELQKQVDELTKKNQELKDRICDGLFGKGTESNFPPKKSKEEEEQERLDNLTFKSIVNPDYQ